MVRKTLCFLFLLGALPLIGSAPLRPIAGNGVVHASPASTFGSQKRSVFHTLFVLDTSGSMKGDKILKAKGAVSYFCAALETEIRAKVMEHGTGLVSFSKDARQIVAQGNKPETIQKNLDQLSAGGNTNLGAGLEQAMFSLRGISGKAVGKVIVLLSDGKITAGQNAEQIKDQLLPQATAEGIRLFTIGVGESSDLDEPLLKSLANMTGGRYFHVKESIGLLTSFRQIRHESSGTVILSETGTIGQGETLPLKPIEVSRPVPALRFDLVWPKSELDLIIKDPSDKEIASGEKGAVVHRDSKALYAVVPQPQEGSWQVSVFGKGVSNDPEPFSFIASTATPAASPVVHKKKTFKKPKPLMKPATFDNSTVVVKWPEVEEKRPVAPGKKTQRAWVGPWVWGLSALLILLVLVLGGAAYLNFRPSYSLEVREPGQEVRIVRLRKRSLWVGRDPSCDVVINDPFVSRKHLEIRVRRSGGNYRDNQTENGTFMGKDRVVEGPLPFGHGLTVGNTGIWFTRH